VRASGVPSTLSSQHATIVRQFKQAWEASDVEGLIGLLAADARAIGDGGGVVRAELRPIEGARQIAWFFAVRASAASDVALLERIVNGQLGLVAQRDGVTIAVYSFGVAGDRIEHIWAILNPEKLRSWTSA
jgi:RNA polymerase sigma-70 factor (ECF subfamily)